MSIAKLIVPPNSLPQPCDSTCALLDIFSLRFAQALRSNSFVLFDSVAPPHAVYQNFFPRPPFQSLRGFPPLTLSFEQALADVMTLTSGPFIRVQLSFSHSVVCPCEIKFFCWLVLFAVLLCFGARTPKRAFSTHHSFAIPIRSFCGLSPPFAVSKLDPFHYPPLRPKREYIKFF